MQVSRMNFLSAKKEKGNTILMVVVLMAVVVLLGGAALSIARNQGLSVNTFMASYDAMRNAETGYNKYLWEFNHNGTFYSDTDKYQLASEDSQKRIYKPIATAHADNYRVEIEIPMVQVGSQSMPSSNQAFVRSTGWSPKSPSQQRTLQVELVKRSFAQFAMITDDNRDESGTAIYWVSGESLYGPLHTNGTLFISGSPKLCGPVSYYGAVNPTSYQNNPPSSIFRGGLTHVSSTIPWPNANTKLLAQARIANKGHYYKGRTCIMLRGDQYDVRCWDADTGSWKYDNIAYQYAPTGSNENQKSQNAEKEYGNYKIPSIPAFSFTGSFSDFRNATYQSEPIFTSLPLPDNGVIYVDGSPASSDTNDLYGNNTAYGSKFSPAFGNLFISGQLEGQLTVAAANDIFLTAYDPTDWRNPNPQGTGVILPVTGGITYSNTTFAPNVSGGVWASTTVNGSDMLGLVGDRKIRILHYDWPRQLPNPAGTTTEYWGGNSSSSRIDMARSNYTIHAAMFVRRSTYGYEFPTEGSDKGNLTVFGSIAQRLRGIVGQDPAGYTKQYYHDPRMLYTTPPYYVQPGQTGWQVGEWKEIYTPVAQE
ncbi:MAG TPA: DUF4900 domain-containing protein [Syntrophomonadaceae bacterium]|nr:DUF4900 domain-containing protein [Syntrophomonadaceae bacterium]